MLLSQTQTRAHFVYRYCRERQEIITVLWRIVQSLNIFIRNMCRICICLANYGASEAVYLCNVVRKILQYFRPKMRQYLQRINSVVVLQPLCAHHFLVLYSMYLMSLSQTQTRALFAYLKKFMYFELARFWMGNAECHIATKLPSVFIEAVIVAPYKTK